MFDRLKHTSITDRILRRPPGLYGAAYKMLEAVSLMTFAQRQHFHAQRIEQMLLRARKLPGYAHAPASNDLADWPITTKIDLLGREQMFATRTLYPAPCAETGGTTGQPMHLKRSIGGIVCEQALIDRHCLSRNIDPRFARIAILRGDSFDIGKQAPGTFWRNEGARKRIYSAHHITGNWANAYIQSLKEFAPEILFCYPSSLAALSARVEKLDGLRIPLIFASSEILQPATLAAARERLGSDVIDYYGHAERIVCASAINNEGYFFQPSYGHVELMPCGEGEARIIATSLWDHGQIFIRYDTGDIAKIPDHNPDLLERIALGVEPFEGIVGRENEYVELGNEQRIIGLNHIPRGAHGAASVQLQFDGYDTIDVFVVPDRNFNQRTIAHITSNLYQKFPQSIGARFWTVDQPLRQKNGKAPLLLRDANIPGNVRPIGTIGTNECAA